MFEKLLEVLARIAAALEKLAAGGTAPEGKPEKPKKEKPAKEETKAAEPETKKADPFADDETPAAPKRTKEEVRKVLTDYANATSNEKALEELAKVTSNKAQRVPDIKPEEYDKVYAAFEPLLAATKK